VKKETVKAVLYAALGNIIWGFSFLFTKTGLAVAPNPNVMLAHRFILSTLFMGIPLLLGKEKISFKGKNWKPVVLLLLMQSCYFLFETYGILYTNATIAGLVLAVVPVVTIGTGALFLREYPTRRQALFCILPVAGVIIMTVSGKELGIVTPLGIIFLLLTMLVSAAFKTANRKAAQEFSSFERTFLVLVNSAVVFSLVGMGSVEWNVAAFAAPLLQGKYLFSVLCLSLLCSIVANLLVNYASGHMSVFKLSSFGSLSTLCSMVAGVVFLREPVSISLLLGAVLILVGIRQVTKPK
jgi:drug/metabolite transporter (DMT)-like permease